MSQPDISEKGLLKLAHDGKFVTENATRLSPTMQMTINKGSENGERDDSNIKSLLQDKMHLSDLDKNLKNDQNPLSQDKQSCESFNGLNAQNKDSLDSSLGSLDCSLRANTNDPKANENAAVIRFKEKDFEKTFEHRSEGASNSPSFINDDKECEIDVMTLGSVVRKIELNDIEKGLSKSSLTKNSDIYDGGDSISYVVYESEKQMPDIMRLITKDLSEPYSIYTYRYFIHNWPKLCFLAMDGNTCIGAIVCKLDVHKKMVRRGYIAMLAVDSAYRRRKLGSTLVTKAIQAMIRDDCDEVVLETEITNQAALHLYENLGFVRDKRLFRYYLNGVDALRLKLWLR